MLTRCAAAFYSASVHVPDDLDFTIHTSNVSPETIAISDCELFVPMGYGLIYYGLPLLAMVQGEKQILAMADTGASFNIIAKQTIKDNLCTFQTAVNPKVT